MIRKTIIISIYFYIAFSFLSSPVFALDGTGEISLDSLEKETKKQLSSSFSIKEIIEGLKDGKIKETMQAVWKEERKMLLKEEKILKELFVQMLSIGFMMAIFSNFSKSFVEQYVGRTGFYIAYMMMCSLMMGQFLTMYELAEEALDGVITFVQVLIPTYSLVLVASGSLTTSLATYELFFFLILAVQWGMRVIILPCIKMSMILKLLNFLNREDVFSGFVELLENLIRLLLKGSIMIVLLFNIFQSMLLPAIDSVKNNVIQKGLGFLPGVGQVFGLVANTVVGSGMILKNAIGVAGMLIICLIVCIPVVKILLYIGSFLLAGALLQPVTDKRLYQALKGVAESGKLLLQALLTSMALFLLTLAIISVTTNMTYFGM